MVPSDMNQLVKLTTSHHESRDVLMVVTQYPLDLHEDGDPWLSIYPCNYYPLYSLIIQYYPLYTHKMVGS